MQFTVCDSIVLALLNLTNWIPNNSSNSSFQQGIKPQAASIEIDGYLYSTIDFTPPVKSAPWTTEAPLQYDYQMLGTMAGDDFLFNVEGRTHPVVFWGLTNMGDVDWKAVKMLR